MRTNLNDEVRSYLKEVASHPVLTREQEVQLFARLASGDESARCHIVEANLRFVIKLAIAYSGRGVPIADLIQEGNIGLLEVVDKFDYTRGYRFSTYAAFWIKQSIQLALRKQCNVIRLPIRKSRSLGYINEAMSRYHQDHGQMPSAEDLAGLLGISEVKLEELMKLRESVLSLDAEFDDEGTCLLNRISDNVTPSPYDRCVTQEKTEHVERMLNTLTVKEKRILELRFGFGTGENMSLRSTSKVVGMSQEGVRRVERKALNKLRRPSNRHTASNLL